MKVALVHDYIKEYGGAERVLEVLAEIYPKAPIYTSFMVKDSSAGRIFKDKKIITSWANSFLPKAHLYSTLRFLTPLIWESFDFSGFDLVISSASWFITKSIITLPKTVHVCYCHTPPRWLYGYKTPIAWKRFLPIRIYGEVVGHFLRQYDFLSGQRVDYFIANSKETAGRIKKFYRRDSTVIYPPVNLELSGAEVARQQFSRNQTARLRNDDILTGELVRDSSKIGRAPRAGLDNSYFLIVSRLSGAKNIDLAIKACNQLKENLWIVGGGNEEKKLRQMAGPTIKFLGQIDDEELTEVYRGCKALLALAQDEDFGITPVEAMAAGRPVIAFRGGGYLETVIDGKTGIFFEESTVESLTEKLKNLKIEKFKPEDCRKQAEKFGKERFKREMKEFVSQKMEEYHARTT